jgi:hypothetical protein
MLRLRSVIRSLYRRRHPGELTCSGIPTRLRNLEHLGATSVNAPISSLKSVRNDKKQLNREAGATDSEIYLFEPVFTFEP